MDIITIGGGIVLLVAPEWAMNVGRSAQDKREATPKWKWICRVLGVVFIAVGILFWRMGI